MTKAIKEVLPNTNHLWCKWHIFKDAPEEIGPVYREKGPFRRDFHYVINQMLTEDEFERAWDNLLTVYKLCENKFLKAATKRRRSGPNLGAKTFIAQGWLAPRGLRVQTAY